MEMLRTELTFCTPCTKDAPLQGLAWVVALRQSASVPTDDAPPRRASHTHSATSSVLAHQGVPSAPPASQTGQDDGGGLAGCGTQVGAGVPLLLVPDADVAAEVNATMPLLRTSSGSGEANMFIARLGCCLMPSTANADDFLHILDMLQMFPLPLTKKVFLDSYSVIAKLSALEDEVSVVSATRGRGARDDAEDEEVSAMQGRSGGGTEPWKFFSTLSAIGPSGEKKKSVRNSWLSKASDAASAAPSTAREHETDRYLREHPSLRGDWSNLTKVLMNRAWILIVAPLFVHLIKTRRECNIPLHAMVTMTACNFAALLLISLECFRLPTLHHIKADKLHVVKMLVSSALMWVGYGVAAACVRDMSDNFADKCSKVRVSLMVLVTTTSALTTISISIYLRKKIYMFHFCNMIAFATPCLVIHALGYAPNHHLWMTLPSNHEWIQNVVASSAGTEEAMETFFTWLDMAAPLAYVAVIHLFLPCLIARRVQRNFVLALLPRMAPKEGLETDWQRDKALHAQDEKTQNVRARRNWQRRHSEVDSEVEKQAHADVPG